MLILYRSISLVFTLLAAVIIILFLLSREEKQESH